MKMRIFQISPEYSMRRAPLERTWMDQTSNAYAYRCLPLNIANQHGWEVLAPASFDAYWDGREHSDAIHFLNYEGDGPCAHSGFGYGIMTFHVPFLFRTEPGYQLIATGPVNVAKDALAPLTGIIESDWSPYSFTMNYRFTRPNQIIHFEKGEPYCMIYPIKLDIVEETEPEIVPLWSNTELCDEYHGWREARQSFYDTANADPESKEAAEQWQRIYFHGRRPSGEKTEMKHRTKLKMHNIAYPDVTKSESE